MYKTNSYECEKLVFKRFTRKGYALFACLGKEVLIGTLSVATLTYAKADGISVRVEKADTTLQTSHRTVMLDGVDITGTRAPLTSGHAARMVTVLSREDVAAASVQSVNDLLKLVAGVDVRQRGPIGAQTDVSVRGGTSEHVTILLNGINICDPQTGHNAFDIPIDKSEIERIEVLEGPAGRVYGTSSLVGAINIVTKPTIQSSADIHAEGGSFGYATAGGRINYSSARWNNQISTSYQRSDGYTRSKSGNLNSDYEGFKAFYQGRYSDRSVKVGWYAGISDKDWGSNTFYSVKSDEQFEHTTKYFTALQAETNGTWFHFRPSIYWNRFSDRYEFYRGRPDKSKYNYNRTDVFGLNLNSWFDWLLGRTAVGAEFRNEDLASGNLGEPLANQIPIHGTDRSYTLGLNRSNLSLHLEHNIILNRLTVSAGFIAIKNTWNEMPFKLYPGVDASYRIGGGFTVYASYNRSLRMPSFTELYYSVDGHKADKHLKPEEMSAVEAGLRYLAEGITGQISVYHHHGTNMIDWIMDTSLGKDAVWTSVNHTKINSFGAEASVRFNFIRLISENSLLRSLNLSYSYINQDKKQEQNLQSLYALEYLRHKFVATANLRPLRDISMNINYRYQYRVGTYTDIDGQVSSYQPYSFVDARLSYDKLRYSFYVEANNLFNTSYVDYGNVPQPGFWFIAGCKVHFKL